MIRMVVRILTGPAAAERRAGPTPPPPRPEVLDGRVLPAPLADWGGGLPAVAVVGSAHPAAGGAVVPHVARHIGEEIPQ
jgi:hypothetical protein